MSPPQVPSIAEHESLNDTISQGRASMASNHQRRIAHWCGHPLVSLRTWTCPICRQTLRPAERARLLQAPVLAPEGMIWVLQERWTDTDGARNFDVISLCRDRRRIARRFVRDLIMDAAQVRELLAQIHWYQGVFNTMLFEGYRVDVDTEREAYRLSLCALDRAQG